MHRRIRLRKANLPKIDIEGTNDTVDHSKPLTEAKRMNAPHTNIQILTDQLNKINTKTLEKEQKKIKKPRYIDTSKLLTFKRSKV